MALDWTVRLEITSLYQALELLFIDHKSRRTTVTREHLLIYGCHS
jgi:hypothetical protein